MFFSERNKPWIILPFYSLGRLRTARGDSLIKFMLRSSPLSINDTQINLHPRSQQRQLWNTFPENLVKSHPHSYLLLPARLQTRLTKDGHSERTIMAAEAKRACSFRTVSPVLGLGTVYSSSNSASSTFPVALLRPTYWSTALLPADCLHVL